MNPTEQTSRNNPQTEPVEHTEGTPTAATPESALASAPETTPETTLVALDPASRTKRLSAAARTTVLAGLIAGGSAGFGVRVLEAPGLLETAAVTAVLLVLGAGVVREEAGKLTTDGFARARRAILSAGAPVFLVVFALSFELSFLRPESLSALPAMVGLKPSENTVLALDLLLPLALLGTVADRAAAGLFLRVFGPTENPEGSDSDA